MSEHPAIDVQQHWTTAMDVQITPLIPFWTGGVEGTTDWLHERGLIGSMRWWYEAIVRGLGREACDPSQSTCTFDAEQYQKSSASTPLQRLRDAGLCDACRVFGATGWRRRLRLTIMHDQTQPIWKDAQLLNIRPLIAREAGCCRQGVWVRSRYD
jgi:CRISPR-associated protein Cmr1